MPRLRRSDPSGPGIARRPRGRGFTYVSSEGERVRDPEDLARIAELAIPPAWRDVWISPEPYGHLQAIGVDAAGRRQYRYHDAWRLRRDREKFDRMLDVARALPALRDRVAADLDQPGLTRERVLACAARLLDVGFFRVGGEDYARQHQTYGLATLQKRHVTVGDGGLLVFDYVAKSGKHRVQQIVDDDVVAIVGALKRRRGGGRELLAYRERPRGRWVDVRSDDVNDYLRAAAGREVTAKDFRTWNATVQCAVALSIGEIPNTTTRRERRIAAAVKEVAHYLGNTPAVCRASYVDPRVIDRFRAGDRALGPLRDPEAAADAHDPAVRPALERAVVAMIEDA